MTGAQGCHIGLGSLQKSAAFPDSMRTTGCLREARPEREKTFILRMRDCYEVQLPAAHQIHSLRHISHVLTHNPRSPKP